MVRCSLDQLSTLIGDEELGRHRSQLHASLVEELHVTPGWVFCTVASVKPVSAEAQRRECSEEAQLKLGGDGLVSGNLKFAETHLLLVTRNGERTSIHFHYGLQLLLLHSTP